MGKAIISGKAPEKQIWSITNKLCCNLLKNKENFSVLKEGTDIVFLWGSDFTG